MVVATGGTKEDMWGDIGVGDMWGHTKRDTKDVMGGEAWGCMWGHPKGGTGGGMHLRGIQATGDPH